MNPSITNFDLKQKKCLSKRQECVLKSFNEGKNYNPFVYFDYLIDGDFWRIIGNVGIPVKDFFPYGKYELLFFAEPDRRILLSIPVY